MVAIRAVRATKELVESNRFNEFKEEELTENFKGKVIVLNAENSEIAKNLKIHKKGRFAIKLG